MFKLKKLNEHVRRAERKWMHCMAGASHWTLSRFRSGSFPMFLIKTLLKPVVSEERTGWSYCVNSRVLPLVSTQHRHQLQFRNCKMTQETLWNLVVLDTDYSAHGSRFFYSSVPVVLWLFSHDVGVNNSSVQQPRGSRTCSNTLLPALKVKEWHLQNFK